MAARQLETGRWQYSVTVGGQTGGFAVAALRVWVGPGVSETVRQHATIHALEVGGMLVGTSSEDMVRVRAVIPAFTSVSPGAQLRVAPATWQAARAELSRYPEMEIVGWYRSRSHGHSRLSPDTVETQARYFARRGQLLLVADFPDTDNIWFIWDGQSLTRLAAHQLSSPPRTAGYQRTFSGGLWAQRVACASAGIALGWAIWSVAIETGGSAAASTSGSTTSGSGPARAHPIVVEPQAGVPTSGGKP